MTIIFYCTCGKRYSANDEKRGKTAKCLSCNQRLIIPESLEEANKFIIEKDGKMIPVITPLGKISDVTEEDRRGYIYTNRVHKYIAIAVADRYTFVHED